MSAGPVNAIAVFGEMLVDRFPGARVVGGAPFNVARHLAAFGHAPLMLGAVGNDDDGQRVQREFERYAMRTSGLQVLPDIGTGAVDVHMAADGSHRFAIRPDAAWDNAQLEPARRAAAAAARGWLYAGTLALRSAVSRRTQLALMREHAGRIFLDINWREGEVDPEVAAVAAGLAHVIKVNEDELPMVCRWFDLPAPAANAGSAELAEAAMALLRKLSLRMVLVTLGARGALCAQNRGVSRALPRRAVRLVDTVGAGDAFAAVALAGLCRGWDTAPLLERAVDFSGHICETRGAVPPDLSAYRTWTAHWASGLPSRQAAAA